MKVCGTTPGSLCKTDAGDCPGGIAGVHDPKPLGTMAVKDPRQPASEELVEAHSQRPGVRLLAQSDGQLLSLHFAEVNADADLILRHVQV